MNTYKKKAVEIATVIGLVFTSGAVLSGCQSKKASNEKTNTHKVSSSSASKIGFTTSSKGSETDTKSSSDSNSIDNQSDSTTDTGSSRGDSTENNSSSTDSSAMKDNNANSGQASSTKTMNVDQIQNGDFSSLIGSWKETASASNNLAGATGTQWSQDSASLGSSLTVSADQITDEGITLKGNHIIVSGDGPSDVTYTSTNGVVNANLADQMAAINYSVSFYPKGTRCSMDMNNGVNDDTTKNRIVFWSSNNQSTQYFVEQ